MKSGAGTFPGVSAPFSSKPLYLRNVIAFNHSTLVYLAFAKRRQKHFFFFLELLQRKINANIHADLCTNTLAHHNCRKRGVNF